MEIAQIYCKQQGLDGVGYKSMHMDFVGIIMFYRMLYALLKCYYILALPCIQGLPKKSGLPSGTPSFLRMS